MREPSASFTMHVSGHQARRRWKRSSETPSALPLPGSVAPVTSTCPWAASAAVTRSRVASAARTCTGDSAICVPKMRVVVVVMALPPFSTISRARRNIAVVLPPPPTSATTSSSRICSAAASVTGGRSRAAPLAGDRAHASRDLVLIHPDEPAVLHDDGPVYHDVGDGAGRQRVDGVLRQPLHRPQPRIAEVEGGEG